MVCRLLHSGSCGRARFAPCRPAPAKGRMILSDFTLKSQVATRLFEKSWEPHKKTHNHPAAPYPHQPHQVPQHPHPPHPTPRTTPRTRTHRTPIRALHAPKHLLYPRTTPQHLRMRRRTRTRPQPRRRTRPLPHPIQHTRHRQPTRLLQRPILSRARYPYNASPTNKVPQGNPPRSYAATHAPNNRPSSAYACPNAAPTTHTRPPCQYAPTTAFTRERNRRIAAPRRNGASNGVA